MPKRMFRLMTAGRRSEPTDVVAKQLLHPADRSNVHTDNKEGSKSIKDATREQKSCTVQPPGLSWSNGND